MWTEEQKWWRKIESSWFNHIGDTTIVGRLDRNILIIASYLDLCQMVMNCEDMILSCISSIIDWKSRNISFHKESLMLGTNFHHQLWMLHPSTHLTEIWTTFGKTWAIKTSFSAHHHSRFKPLCPSNNKKRQCTIIQQPNSLRSLSKRLCIRIGHYGAIQMLYYYY